MRLGLIISKQFDELFKMNGRYIDIDTDINISEDTSNIIKLIEGKKMYYQISAKRFIKVEWIINRMNDYLENEGYYIDELVAEEIVREIAKTKSINRRNLKNIFFTDISIITKHELNNMKKNVIQKQEKVTNKLNFIQNAFEDVEVKFYNFNSNFEVDNYNLRNNIAEIYGKYKNVSSKEQNDLLIELRKKINFKDIRDLCHYTRLANIEICISDVIEIMDLKRVGIHKVEPANSKYNLVTLNFQTSLLELKRLMNNRDWDCYSNYTIDKKITLSELGNKFKISRQRVLQIINKSNIIVVNNSYLFLPFRDYLNEIFKYIDYVSIDELKKSKLIYFSKSNEVLELELKFLNQLFETNYHIYNNYIFNFDISYVKEKLVSEILLDSVDLKVLNKEQLLNYVKLLNFKYPKDVYEYIISLIDDILIDNEEKHILIKNGRINNSDICKWILHNIGYPVHYSLIHERYCQYTKNYNVSLHSILATLDRSEDQGIIRTFTGTYGLVELGAQKHASAKEIAINILEEFNRPMHYTEIIREVQRQSEAKDNTIYANLNNSSEIISNNEGVYALEIWKDKLDDAFLIKRENERRLIEHSYNKYNKYSIKYLISETIIKDNSLRLPINIPCNLDSIIRILNSNNDEFIIKYNSNSNYLSGFNRVLNFSNIKSKEYIYIEIISSDYIKIYKEIEYKMYLEGVLSFGNLQETYDIEEDDVIDLLGIFYKDV